MKWKPCETDAGPCFCTNCPDWKKQTCMACGKPYGDH